MFLSLHFCTLGGVGSTRNWNFISFPWFHLIKTVYRKQSIWFIRVFFAENSCRLCLRMTVLRVMRTNSNSFWAPKPKQRAESQHLQRVWPHSQMPYPPTATTLYCTLAVKKCGATAHTEGACVSVFEIRSTCIIFTTDTWQQRSRPRITAAVRLINGSEDNSTC